MASVGFKAGVAVGATAAAGGGGYAINLAVNKDKGEQETINPEEKDKQEKKLTLEEIEAEAKKKEEAKEEERKREKQLEEQRKAEEKKAEAAKKEAERIEREGPSFSGLHSTKASYAAKTIGSIEGNKERLAAADLPENEEWWKWSYRKRWETRENKEVALESPFNNITTAHNKTLSETPVAENKSLNQACHEAYKLTLRDFYLKDSLVDAISKFCIKKEGMGISTPDWEQPGNVSLLKDLDNVNDTYNGKFGLKNNNKDHLVSPLAKDNNYKNEEWWIWNYMQNYKKRITFKGPFESLTSAYSAEEGAKITALNQACNSVYKQTLPITDETLQNNISSFCMKNPDDASNLIFTA